jgi:hypothetical protein
VAQHARIGAGEEMAALDQHVGRNRHLHAGRRREQGAVVADAEDGAARAAGGRLKYCLMRSNSESMPDCTGLGWRPDASSRKLVR